MLTVKYIQYYLNAMKCYKKFRMGWYSYYGIQSNMGYTFLDACWFTYIFITFFIFPIILDIFLIPLYVITYVIQKFIKEGK